MSHVDKAVILVAGLGSRLKPLTDETPKCLTEVNGTPILSRDLEILERNGISETAIVVGYLGDKVIDRFGGQYGNMELTYIWNEVYAETNSMYSAWLAREYLTKGAFLIEGDTFFDECFIGKALATDESKAYWVVDRFAPEYDGSMSIADDSGRIVDLKIVRTQLDEYRSNYYKSTGVVKMSPEYGRSFALWLDDDVQAGNVNIYYDLVISKHLQDAPIYVLDITGKKWMEIDNLEDLAKAESMFADVK